MKCALALLALVVMAIFPEDVKGGGCCPTTTGYSKDEGKYTRCNDGTRPMGCCSKIVGGCNLFCCDCYGGCRGARSDLGEAAQPTGFDLIDLNKDGLVNITEAETYLRSGACGHPETSVENMPAEFARLDLDLDGHLSMTEIGA